jgi:hypothetical protein
MIYTPLPHLFTICTFLEINLFKSGLSNSSAYNTSSDYAFFVGGELLLLLLLGLASVIVQAGIVL